MRDFTFYKLCGTGNDFVMVDNRENVIGNRKKLAQVWELTV